MKVLIVSLWDVLLAAIYGNTLIGVLSVHVIVSSMVFYVCPFPYIFP